MLLERPDMGFGSSIKTNLHLNNSIIPANCFIQCTSGRRSMTWTWKESHPKPSSHQLGWFHCWGETEEQKTLKQKVVMVKNFLAMADTGMMSPGDNQAASFPPRLQSQVFMFQKGKKRSFSLALDQNQPGFFSHWIKWARRSPPSWNYKQDYIH